MGSGSRAYPSRALAVAAWLALALACEGASAQQAADDLGLRSAPADPSPSAAAPLDGDATTDATANSTPRADDSKPKKKPKPKRRTDDAKGEPGALPPLKPYKGAQRLDSRGGAVSPDADGLRGAVPAPTVAALPTPPPPRRILRDENPYDPLGERVGDLKLTPYVEQDGGWASNPNGVSIGAKGSAFETTEVGAALQSDWSANDLHGQLKGGYTDYFTAPTVSGPFGSGTLDGREDVSKQLSFDAEGRFNIARESLTTLGVTPGSAGFSAETTASTYGATVGGAQKFGDLTLALHGTYDRTTYSDDSATTGLVGNLANDDYNDFGVKARASYRWSDVVSPFVEFDADDRRYDGVTDAEGYQRDSTGLEAKAGLAIAYSPQLTGETSVGFGERHYQDPRLRAVDTPLFDAALIWSATPLTTLTLRTQSQILESVLVGASADVNRAYTIGIDHALTRQIKLGVSGGYATDDYVGAGLHDATTTLGASAEYHLTREIVVKASATRSQFTSSAPNSNYVANVFMLGLRLQR